MCIVQTVSIHAVTSLTNPLTTVCIQLLVASLTKTFDRCHEINCAITNYFYS